MEGETRKQRSDRILRQLKAKYPGKEAFDFDDRGLHFVCEVEPTKDHPEYDRVIEVILLSKPHKHLEMIQHYTILSGVLQLHVGEEIVMLCSGDTYVIRPSVVHWAKSDGECWVEICSRPGWTKEDHIVVDL